jgi:hypothetical protein
MATGQDQDIQVEIPRARLFEIGCTELGVVSAGWRCAANWPLSGPCRAVPCGENDVSRAATSRDEPAPDLSGRLTGDAHLQHVEAARLKKSQRVGRVTAGAAGLKAYSLADRHRRPRSIYRL